MEGFKNHIQPFFEEHCIRCHGPEKSKGKLTLHQLKGVGGDDEEMTTWEDILEMVEDGDMPPDDEPQPSEADREAVTSWIEQSLKSAAATADDSAHTPIARRLTNFEYQNTMRDLFGVDIDLLDNLSEDPIKPYEFNNSSELMRIGPEQIDRYLENARRMMDSVIVDPEKPEPIIVRKEWGSELHEKQKMPRSHVGVYGNSRGSAAKGFSVNNPPRTGPFRLLFKASAVMYKNAEEVPLRWIMGESIQVNSSTKRVEPVGTVLLKDNKPRVFELTGRIENFPVETSRRHKNRTLPDALSLTPQNLFNDGTLSDDRSFFKEKNADYPRPVIEWVEFEAPVYETWPPEHHTRILFESPLRDSDKTAYVRQVLERFMSRAYRRPATEREVERQLKIYQLLAPEMKSFEDAIRETLAMVLITPQFLMHTVTDGERTTPEYALASRLSYFLWGSMPDEKLLALAADGAITSPNVLRGEIERMIGDQRFGDFVSNFTMQWMSLDKMRTVPINRELFPRFLYDVTHGERRGTEIPYIPTIRDHMIAETIGYVKTLFVSNAPVSQLVDSDFAFVNQALAAHYGIPGVKSHEHQVVPLQPGHHLGGLLTHGSVLIGNGTGTAPHPIYRAVWLREAILGEEVAPPPAEVPALADTAGESAEKAVTIKDLLAMHRKESSCNDCHARLDPWGIPFEQYNAIGKYQPKVTKEGLRVEPFIEKKHTDLKGYHDYLESIYTEPIDAVAKLPNGPEVESMEELKQYILAHRIDDVADNLARRLLTYGIGRHLTYRDRPAVDEILAHSATGKHRLNDLLVSICMSRLFAQP